MENWKKRERVLAPGEDRVWIIRLNKLLEKRGMSNKDLSLKSGVSESAISDWFRKGREPSYTNIENVTMALNISPNYFFGKHDCVNPKDNFIHAETGLSEEAIKNLRRLQKSAKKGGVSREKIGVINLLIENAYAGNGKGNGEEDLLIHLYQYLTDYYLSAAKKLDGNEQSIFILEVGGEEFDPTPYNRNFLETAMLGYIQNDIVQLKKRASLNQRIASPNKKAAEI